MAEPKTGQSAAAVALAATIYFLVAAIATHIVSTQYDPIRDYISDYAVGPQGWIYGSAFWASFVGSIALALALARSVPPAARSRIGIGMLAVVGVTFAIDSLFPTDILPPGVPPQTTVGYIHFLDAVLGWLLFTVSAFLISSRLRRDSSYWQSWHRPLMVFSLLALVLLVVLVAVVVSKRPIGGLAEKAFIVDRNIWALLAITAVLRTPRGGEQ